MLVFVLGAVVGAALAWLCFMLIVVPSLHNLYEDFKFYKMECDRYREKEEDEFLQRGA